MRIVPLTLNLLWTASSTGTETRLRTRTESDGTTVSTRLSARVSDATVTGSIFGPGGLLQSARHLYVSADERDGEHEDPHEESVAETEGRDRSLRQAWVRERWTARSHRLFRPIVDSNVSCYDQLVILRTVAAVLLTLPIVSAQIGVIQGFFPPQLKAYLELTDDQIQAITNANTDLNTFRATKLQRQLQVHSELAQEMAKQTLDPMSLGLRYMELEAIRRELNTEQQKTATAVQNILTAPQKTKAAALQQALQFYPTACAAVEQNVLSTAAPRPGNIIPVIGPNGGFTSFLLGPLPASDCNVGPRTGAFTFSPSQPQFGSRIFAEQ